MSAPTRGTRDTRPRGGRDRLRIEDDIPTVYVSRRRVPWERVTDPSRKLAGNARTSLAPMAGRARPFGVASAIAAAWAVVMGLIVVGVPVLLTWALAAHTRSSAGEATVVAADVWLAAHHVPLTVGDARLGLLPLGLLVVPFLLLRLSAGWATRILAPSTLPDAGLLVAGTAVVYGLLGGLVAALSSRSAGGAAPLEALLWCTVIAAVCAGWTVVRTSGLTAQLGDAIPAWLRSALRPAAAALATVVALSALVTLGSLLVHSGDALAVARELDAGPVGGLTLAVLCVLYLPNLVIWAAAFCLGPGFAVGSGTSVTLAGVSTGELPAFPLLAAVPASGVPAAPAWLCLLVPVVAGLVAARSTVRARPGLDAETTALWAGFAGVLAGFALGVLAWLSGGPLGDGRLSVVGPSAWQVAALGALEIGLVAAVAAWTMGWRASRLR